MTQKARRPRPTDKRVSRQIPPKESVLIVCEGGKTEPQYFELIGRRLGLIGRYTHVEVAIKGEQCGSAPKSVVYFALQLRDEREEKASKSTITRKFDRVYCVIDRDKHKPETLDSAFQKANGNNIDVVLSNPCFEYWFLLHFEKYAKPFLHHSKVATALKKKYSKYDKSRVQGEFFDTLFPCTEDAIANAKEVIREKGWGKDLRKCNPSTHVHLLVAYLRAMVQKPY